MQRTEGFGWGLTNVVWWTVKLAPYVCHVIESLGTLEESMYGTGYSHGQLTCTAFIVM